MVSEDSGCLRPVQPSIAPVSVHGQRRLDERFEALHLEMTPFVHRTNYAGECNEVALLRAQEWLRLEERDDPRQQVFPISNNEHQRGVRARSMILTNATAAEPVSDEVQDLPPLGILADVKFGNQLPPEPGARVPANRDVKRAFSVDEPRDIGIQPFLLIVRTGWIVTAHAFTLNRG
jgi:hypothetical protein